MTHLFVVRYAEIALKGNNRHWFEKTLVNNLKQQLKPVTKVKVTRIYGRILVEAEQEAAKIEQVLKCVPGIANFSQAVLADHDIQTLGKIAVEMAQSLLEGREKEQTTTFKVSAKRGEKAFPLNSPQLAAKIGEILLNECEGLKVKLDEPELEIFVEIWQQNRSAIYAKKIPGQGGLPVGSSGDVISFLSGGIDSPVASWMLMKRGCKTTLLHFHSFPFIGEQSKQKVIDLAQHLARFQPHTRLIVVPFAEVQTQIKQCTHEKYRTLLYRRMMNRIAAKLNQTLKAKAFVTGEAVGQVASQTLENLACTQAVAPVPVLRPLVGMEKAEITTLAKRLGTYEISIRPHADCCTLFQPKRPETKAKIDRVAREETRFEAEALAIQAAEDAEWLLIEPQEM